LAGYKSREFYGLLVGLVSFLLVWAPAPAFLAALAALCYGMARELEKALNEPGLAYGSVLSLAAFLVAPPLGLTVAALTALYEGYRRWRLERFFKSFFLNFYPPFFLSYLYPVYEDGLLLVLLAAVFAQDVAAYYAGRRLGRRPLFPKLSPKKTVEGFLAGLTAGTAAGLLLLQAEPAAALKLVAVLTVAVAGDYFKSFIKRQLGLKDFSNLLGEHGGLTDRFDALTFAAPVFYLLFGS